MLAQSYPITCFSFVGFFLINIRNGAAGLLIYSDPIDDGYVYCRFMRCDDDDLTVYSVGM